MSSEHCYLTYEEVPEPEEGQKEEPKLNLLVNPHFKEGAADLSDAVPVIGTISLSF